MNGEFYIAMKFIPRCIICLVNCFTSNYWVVLERETAVTVSQIGQTQAYAYNLIFALSKQVASTLQSGQSIIYVIDTYIIFNQKP